MKKINNSIKPVLKWTGGKKQVVDVLKENMPKHFNIYYELMLGGGALAFELAHSNAVINDKNKDLMNVYVQIRDNLEKIAEILDEHEKNHNEEYFYLIRNKFNNRNSSKELDVEDAGMMIYLNKSCFNGLYRVNKKGEFNVGWNKKDTVNTYEYKNMRAMSNYLKDVIIRNDDYYKLLSECQAGDFVYIDCPSTSANNKKACYEFTEEDHKDLIYYLNFLTKNKVYVMITMQKNDRIETIYRDCGYNFEYIDSRNRISCKGDSRKGSVAILKNYELSQE